MTVVPVRLFGDPVLRTPSVQVTNFDAELRKLVADLTDTMHEEGGAGLAAPLRERALVRAPRAQGRALAAALAAVAGQRSARKAPEPVRVRLDPPEVG